MQSGCLDGCGGLAVLQGASNQHHSRRHWSPWVCPAGAYPQERPEAKDQRRLVNWLDRAGGSIGKLDRCQALDGYRACCPVIHLDFGGAHRILGCHCRYGSLAQGGSGWRPGDPLRHCAWVPVPSHRSVHPSDWRPVQGWRRGWSAEACKSHPLLGGWVSDGGWSLDHQNGRGPVRDPSPAQNLPPHDCAEAGALRHQKMMSGAPAR